MRIYATAEDLTDEWLGDTPTPRNLPGLLRNASILVEQATRLSRYKVDEQGYPTEPQVKEAFKNAVLNQIVVWAAAGIDPTKGMAGQKAQVSSQSVPGGSVSYAGVFSAQELGNIGQTLDPISLNILAQAGLNRTEVRYKL